jgi:hypothetical protein
MSAEQRRVIISPNAIRLLVLLAFLCFVAAECVAQTWLTKGTWQEWTAGGLAFYVLAELA